MLIPEAVTPRMTSFLGIDTSNYTTSAAIYTASDDSVIQEKLLLPVKDGELGLRQSDAVFHHTKQLPVIIKKLFCEAHEFQAVGVSVRPRDEKGSYMPCFLSGEAVADCIGAVNHIPVYKASHQAGHILAALYSCRRLELIHKSFIAFHVSGGTTDCLFVQPDNKEIIKISLLSASLDLKAGQAVDRVGLMLGLKFPCGKELERLALKSSASYNIRPVIKGMNCSLSGVENKCGRMLSDGEGIEDIAKYCLDFICSAIDEMTRLALLKAGELPVVYAGGVMSNSIIRKKLTKKYGALFAAPEFSCDNAVGTAIFAALKEKK